MKPDILVMWFLAMHSDDFKRLTRQNYEKSVQMLRSPDGGFSAVGVLCDLYCQSWGEDHWVKTNLAYEWDGIYLGEAPDEVIVWAFDLKNYGFQKATEAATIKKLRKTLFDFDMFFDTKKSFPNEGMLRRVFR